MGAVDTLIVWENLAIHRVVVRNNSTGTTNTLYLSEEQCLDATFFKDLPSRHCHLDIVLHAFKCHPRPSAHFNSNSLLLCSDTS